MKDYFKGETADRLFKELGVEERNVGKWIIYDPQDIGTTNCRCSNCRTEFFFPAIEVRPYAYCPACGARMEG